MYNYIDEAEDETHGFGLWKKSGCNKVLISVGNHEWNKQSTGYSSTTALEVYNKYFAPYIANWGVVQPTNAAEQGLMYYYKDYTTQKVRLIVLDATPSPLSRFDDTQKTWFAQTLEDARTKGYAVVVANHYGFDYTTIATRQKNNFDSLLNEDVSGGWLVEESAATIVDTFISNGGKFVCWLAGHTHVDYFCTLDSHNKQAVININCAMTEVNGQRSDQLRRIGYDSEYCFNIVKIDTADNTFTLARFGANADRLLRKRESLTWDYANGKLIYQ